MKGWVDGGRVMFIILLYIGLLASNAILSTLSWVCLDITWYGRLIQLKR